MYNPKTYHSVCVKVCKTLHELLKYGHKYTQYT